MAKPRMGSSSTNVTNRGFLYEAIEALQCSINSAASTDAPSSSTTMALTDCAHRSSGTPITAAARTCGCWRKQASTSAG